MTGETKDNLWEKYKDALHSVNIKTLNCDKTPLHSRAKQEFAKPLVHIDAFPAWTTSTASEIYVLAPDHKLYVTDRLIDLKHPSDYSSFLLINLK